MTPVDAAKTCAGCAYHDDRDEPEERCFFDGKLCFDRNGWTPRLGTGRAAKTDGGEA